MNNITEVDIEENVEVNSYLTFKLDDESFAVEVQRVIEILEIPNITVIPRAPSYMAGIINLRGKVLPLIDTKIKFGLVPIEFKENTCIIVIEIDVEGDKMEIGTLVDAVNEVMDIPAESLLPSPSIEAKYSLNFIDGRFLNGDDYTMVLNLDEVFSLMEMDFMQEVGVTMD
ncbi:MAG: purine-binding chemotaxis protein CheW [Cytophagales bacterium]|nr:purine-binding chemotaxis protein CheW [Cytophagales bacterium]